MALTDAKIRAAKPASKPYKIFDTGGLFVDARRCRDTALCALDEGRDPSAERREAKKELRAAQSLNFEIVARAWHAARKNQWAPKYSAQILKRLEVDLLPEIGACPIDGLEPQDLLAALQKVEERGVLELKV